MNLPKLFRAPSDVSQELFACVKSVFLKKVLRFLRTLQNYLNAKLDKTERLITSNKFKTERYQRK